jgi:hypothetical protein
VKPFKLLVCIESSENRFFLNVLIGNQQGRWFSPGNPVSSSNKTDRHDITEMLLKVALNTIIKPSIS